MSIAFVVDCSVAMTWLFKDEATPLTAGLLNRLDLETAVVPALWYFELCNVMALAERKGRITSIQTEQFISELMKLNIEIDLESQGRSFTHILPLCRTHRLTSYDAVYLDLAIRRNLPLATLDDPLSKAAKSVGIKML